MAILYRVICVYAFVSRVPGHGSALSRFVQDVFCEQIIFTSDLSNMQRVEPVSEWAPSSACFTRGISNINPGDRCS